MQDLARYYLLLGLPEGAPPDAIKKAYREKAKQYHPDRNKAPDAHQRFVDLTEAYECLVGQKKQWRFDPFTSARAQDEAQARQRSDARRKAAEQARMRYEAFMQSEYYKATSGISAAMDLLIVLALLTGMVLIPLFAYRHGGTLALTGSLLMDGGVAGLFLYAVRRSKVDIRQYLRSLGFLLQWRWTYLVLLSLFNIIVFFRIGLRTLLPVSTLFLAYLTFAALTYFAMQLRRKSATWFVAACVVPAGISLMLTVNYVFSSAPRWEEYHFEQPVNTTVITLESNMYDAYGGLRTFVDQQELKYVNTVHYRIEQGRLGFRVMKEYRLTRTPGY